MARFEDFWRYLVMRAISKKILCFAALIAMLAGCRGIDNPEGDLKGIKLEDWPLTDCSTSTRPVRDLMRVDMLSIDGVAPTKESL